MFFEERKYNIENGGCLADFKRSRKADRLVRLEMKGHNK